jgi:hypothetical protein
VYRFVLLEQGENDGRQTSQLLVYITTLFAVAFDAQRFERLLAEFARIALSGAREMDDPLCQDFLHDFGLTGIMQRAASPPECVCHDHDHGRIDDRGTE